MIETEIKKLTEALIEHTAATCENNRLLDEHIAIRRDNNPDGTAKCCKEKAEPDAEPDETQELIDEANAREAKKRKAAARKKAKAEKEAAEAAEAADKAVLNDDEDEDIPDDDVVKPVKGKVTADDLREYVQAARAALKKDGGPKAVSQHRKDFRELLKDGGHNSISDIPADELADFLEDTKALVE